MLKTLENKTKLIFIFDTSLINSLLIVQNKYANLTFENLSLFQNDVLICKILFFFIKCIFEITGYNIYFFKIFIYYSRI